MNHSDTRRLTKLGLWAAVSLLSASGCAQILGADFDAKTTFPEYFGGAGGTSGSGGKSGSGGRASGGNTSGNGGGKASSGGAPGSGGKTNSGGVSSGGASGGSMASGGDAGGAAINPCEMQDACDASAVVINEISAQGRPDFIELYNAGTKTADLAGYAVTDGDVAPDIGHLSILPQGTYLEPGKFLYMQEEDPLVNCALGSDDRCEWFGFGISKSGDTVFLLDPDNMTQDSMSYPMDGATLGLSDSYTWGRFPDGGATLGRLLPTEKAANVSAMP